MSSEPACPVCHWVLPREGDPCPACASLEARRQAASEEATLPPGATVDPARGASTLDEVPPAAPRSPGEDDTVLSPRRSAPTPEPTRLPPNEAPRAPLDRPLVLGSRSEHDTIEEPPSSHASASPGSSKPVLPSAARRATPIPTESSSGSSLASRGPVASDGGELRSFDGGKYAILREIARGGMGAVYQARQVDLNRIVALKVMLAGALASEGEKKRFLREAEASARLKHPNIVPVYDIGEVDGNLYFTMDFVEGASLSERKGSFTREKLLDIMIKVCDAVAYAHMRGIIHRDLKPANILIDRRDEPLIMDFGLAKETSTENDSGSPDVRTREGSVMGTPHYMPPEQALGYVSDIDVRSDVYSLGVIIYELWTRQLPFQSKRMTELLMLVVDQEPRPLRSLDATIPWEIDAIALKAMEKDKARRYESALELKRDLERFKAGELIVARQASVLQRAVKWTRRHRVALAFGAVLLVALGTAGVSVRRAQTEATRQRFAKAEADLAAATHDLGELERRAPELEKATLALERGVPGASPEEGAPLEARLAQDLEGAIRARAALDALAKDPEVGSIPAIGGAAGTREVSAGALQQSLARLADGARGARKAREESLQGAQESESAARLFAAGPGDAAAVDDHLTAAREHCYAAIGLGGRSLVAPTLAAVTSLGTALAARRATEESRREALAQLGRARAGLETARATPDLAARRQEAQGALAAVGEGLRVGGSLPDVAPELARAGDDAHLLLGETLLALGYFAFAEDEARRVPAERGARLLQVCRETGALAVANKKALQEADALFRSLSDTKDDAARARAAEDVQRTAAGLAGKGLAHDDEIRRGELEQASAHEAVVFGARARLTLARRLEVSRDPHGARREATAAIPLLEKAGLAREAAEAREILAQAAREISTPSGMILVPELSSVRLGGDDRNPERTVALVRAFYMAKLEVTNDDYLEFVRPSGYDGYNRAKHPELWDASVPLGKLVDATGRPGPLGWENGEPPKGEERLAVAGVSYWEACAYAAFRGRRLPTDEEWEVAARAVPDDKGGVASRVYPWGDAWEPLGPALGSRRRPEPVGPDGAHEDDRSATGCRDMAANVAEWVAASSDPRLPCRPEQAPVRGGSYLAPLKPFLKAAHRALVDRSFRGPGIGLRLAVDPDRPAAADRATGDVKPDGEEKAK